MQTKVFTKELLAPDYIKRIISNISYKPDYIKKSPSRTLRGKLKTLLSVRNARRFKIRS